MEWKSDKIAHYKYCYEHTKKALKGTTLGWSLCVFTGVSFYKEIIHDLIFQKGTCDKGDVYANWCGCMDALKGKESRF